ncbi:MAG: hypothetical protein D3915_03685 [Candidatus Electrothrix sp. AU1_5]|nr:hypothetical protein [Candidatus Electrothrix gigas]
MRNRLVVLRHTQSISDFLLLLLLLFLLFLLMPCGCSRNSKGNIFLQGRKAVTQGRFQKAIPVLRRYLQEKPHGKHASRALFFIAKAHIGLGEYDRAQAAFASLIREMPDTLEARKAEYKLALLDLWQDRTKKARQRLQAITAHPDSPLVPEAQAMLRYLEKEQESWKPQPQAW